VCEVPDWGFQMEPDLVLSQMSALGLGATEAGPPGFLPADTFAAKTLLQRHALRMIGGFVTAVLHRPERRATELASVERQASWLAALGGEVLVLAAATGRTGYSASDEVGDDGWAALFAALDVVAATAARHRLTLAVHPHFGTVIERRAHVERFLAGCAHGLCLDTGHLALGGADPVEIARRAGGRIRHVHLKDVDATLGPSVTDRSLDYAPAVRRGLYCALGEGSARIADVLALLRGTGYDGWYVLEQDVMLDRAPSGVPPWIEASVAFARASG
jgi:inosose dehydratase